MLCLSAKLGESIFIEIGGETLQISYLSNRGSQIKLGFTAPEHAVIWRDAIYRNILREREARERETNEQKTMNGRDKDLCKNVL